MYDSKLYGRTYYNRIKFLEKGLTYMRPDSIHGSIGIKRKKAPEVLDWNDLEQGRVAIYLNGQNVQ